MGARSARKQHWPGVGRDDAAEAAGGMVTDRGNSSATVISKPEPSKAIF